MRTVRFREYGEPDDVLHWNRYPCATTYSASSPGTPRSAGSPSPSPEPSASRTGGWRSTSARADTPAESSSCIPAQRRPAIRRSSPCREAPGNQDIAIRPRDCPNPQAPLSSLMHSHRATVRRRSSRASVADTALSSIRNITAEPLGDRTSAHAAMRYVRPANPRTQNRMIGARTRALQHSCDIARIRRCVRVASTAFVHGTWPIRILDWRAVPALCGASAACHQDGP